MHINVNIIPLCKDVEHCPAASSLHQTRFPFHHPNPICLKAAKQMTSLPAGCYLVKSLPLRVERAYQDSINVYTYAEGLPK